MTNNEVLKNYGTEEWVVREMLSYLLMEYTEKLGVETSSNPVAFVIEFLNKETIDVDGKEI